MPRARHLLSIADLGTEVLLRLVEDSVAIGKGCWDLKRPLSEKVVGLCFRRTSTRTRTAFTVGAMKLGARVIAYGPADLQIVTGETLGDTVRVLSSYLDVLVLRSTESMIEMRELAAQSPLALVNALSDNEHPTQALADLATIQEALGGLDGVHVLYLGEGNCTAASLALAVGKIPGMRLTLVSPAGYGLMPEVLEQAQQFARQSGATIVEYHEMARLPRAVDVVYTSRWLQMGVQKPDADWLAKFRPYAVTEEVMAEVSKHGGTVFLHDLPAMRGFEVTNAVLDGAQSIAFRQAFHKMTSAMAVLSWCAAGD